MTRTKVFLSYSHRHTSTRFALAGALTNPEFEVRWDAGQTHTPELHREISGNLNWCDVVVPIITTDWLSSHECRDELVRANERRKPIIPFRHRNVSDDGPPKVPWYLREMLYVTWDEDELPRAINELVDILRNFAAESWKVTCYRDIRLIGDTIQQARSAATWRSVLCQRLLANTQRQARDILVTHACAFNVSHEYAYLRFAEPIFGQAKTIVAICIASISTFWTNPDFRSAAGNYLTSQRSSAESICRLFVFESVDEVMRFREILQNHHEAYGKITRSNGVFLSSTSSYQKLLGRWSMENEGNALRQDFGLLSFEPDHPSMYATLDQKEFRYSLYEDEDVTHATYRIILEHFETFRTLELGAFDSNYGIARWSPEWASSDHLLGEALSRLFQDRSSPVTHFVLLRPAVDTPEISSYIHQLVSRFHKHKAALRLTSVSVKQRCNMAVTDGRYAAPLVMWHDFDYLLVMEFEDEVALRHYYQHELHSIERENLYLLLKPEIRSAFEEISRLDQRQVSLRADAFMRVERALTEEGFIRRIDVKADDPLALLFGQT